MDKREAKTAEDKDCGTCRHGTVSPTELPCVACMTGERWEPKESGQVIYAIGIDPGTPEGDRTNARLDWGESGPELIVPPDITSVDQLKDGLLAKATKAYLKQITRLDYAIAGVWSKISSNGIKLTDKNLSRDELTLLVCQLNALQLDLFELEDEREALWKASDQAGRA